MTMKFTQMITHFKPDEALEVIAFLDQLRNALWTNYREEIEALQREEQIHHTNGVQQRLNLDDPVDF